MKRRKRRAMLFLALALLAGTWLMTVYMARLDEQAAAVPAEAEHTGYALSVGTQKELTALSWAWNGGTVNLRRNSRGTWENAEDPDCPLDASAVGRLTRAAASVTASMAVEGVTEFAQYGLDEPALTVMAAAGDRIATYEVGNGTITGEYYLREDGGDTVYLEDGGLAAAFRTELASLLKTESLPADMAEITGLAVETDVQSYELSREGGRWLRTDGGRRQPLEDGAVQSLYELLMTVDLTRCAGWDAEDGLGFDAPQGTATVSYLDAAGAPGSFTLEFGAYDGREVFVRFAGSRLAYRTSAAPLDALMYPDWTAMLPMKVMDPDLERVASLVIVRDGVTREVLRLQEEGSAEAVYSADGWVFDTRRMESWLKKLSALTAEGTAAASEGRSELFSLTLIMKPEEPVPQEEGGETEEEADGAADAEALPAAEPETLSVCLWQYDSARALCVTGDRNLLIPKETALALTEELDAILADR